MMRWPTVTVMEKSWVRQMVMNLETPKEMRMDSSLERMKAKPRHLDFETEKMMEIRKDSRLDLLTDLNLG